MKKINNPKIVRKLALLCSLTYLASYLTRINFGAVTVAIIKEYGWEKTAVSAVTTALFISYGIGQLISGFLADRIKPSRIMAFGLFASAAMNLLIPICTNVIQMTVIWTINGLAQAMMWPPIVRILAGGCHKKDYQNATVIVSWGSSIGTILVFLLASICTVYDWRMIFRICAVTAVATAIIWLIGYSRIERYSESEDNAKAALNNLNLKDECGTPSAGNDRKKMPGLLIIVLGVVLMAVIILGALRDSITTWLPNYISETFNLDSSSALLTSVILPIFTTITYPLVLLYYRKFFVNELMCAATIYGLSAVSAILLCFFSEVNPIFSVLLLALITACAHGANFLIIGLVPKKFDKYGNVATISGVINSFVYVGSSLSIWGIALIAEKAGWFATIVTWGVLALIGTVICFAVSRKFQSFFK